MDRRSFLKTSALGGSAAAASTLAAPALCCGQAGSDYGAIVATWLCGFG